MKKIAITISMATLILAGITGCGDANQNDDGAGAYQYQTGQGTTNGQTPGQTGITENDGALGGQGLRQSAQRRTGMFTGQRNNPTEQGNGSFGNQGSNQTDQTWRTGPTGQEGLSRQRGQIGYGTYGSRTDLGFSQNGNGTHGQGGSGTGNINSR
ncbi:hypothetical protein [Evansella tamaricis]|uniref:Uncharacterized protein n=1 Tax=Evansella tamaricis TaxID=2069301 RepID=A0ABS6JFJ8_9BACI|nr:hypothetical protein [Evansella tamaricis]MBU9712308.1 hypothetical protein [Evansella tamaricis]